MEELENLRQRMLCERPAEWSQLPDLALYMDQLIAYMPRQLIQLGEGDALTSAMVNNYIKDGLLPRAEGKRYGRAHLAYLTAICAMKPVLSVKEMASLVKCQSAQREPEDLYALFRERLDAALTKAAGSLEHAAAEEDSLASLALTLALESYAAKLACHRVLDLLREGEAPQEPDKEKKKK